MRQFDIVRLIGRDLAVLLQHNLPDERETMVAPPLFLVSSIVPTQHLHPVVKIDRRNNLIATKKLSTISKRDFEAVIGLAAEQEYEICRALDLVYFGI